MDIELNKEEVLPANVEKKQKKNLKSDLKKDKIDIVKYDDLEGKFLHIKVGTEKSPASEKEIKDIESKIIKLFEKNNVNCIVFISHHAVDVKIIEKFK
jgi:hypothetical protein